MITGPRCMFVCACYNSYHAAVSCIFIVTICHFLLGFSRMDEATALFILQRMIHDFISIVTEQAKVLPGTDGK